MGIFSKASNDEVFGTSKYFQPGRYLVEIKKVKSFDGQKGVAFVIETLVKGAISDHKNAPKVGESAAHVWNLGGSQLTKTMGMSNWWGFAMAALGVEDKNSYTDTEWEDASEDIIDNGSLEGQLMCLECFFKKTKEKQQDFTVHKWLREATQEDLDEFGVIVEPSE